ncbi:zinc ribbon domain-containing protein, partial [Streptomyces sp. NPDC005373]
GVFLTIRAAKAESAGREVIAVDPRNTSRQCSECGHTSAENRLTQEQFHRVSCGRIAHADTVGALNVLRAGLVRLLYGPVVLGVAVPALITAIPGHGRRHSGEPCRQA